MRVRIRPGGAVAGEAVVPGDKSVAHRWLILAATAEGVSQLSGLPRALDVRSTGRVMATLVPSARASLEAWLAKGALPEEAHGFTWDPAHVPANGTDVVVEAEGRRGLVAPDGVLDCGNSGTTLRLLCGVLASTSFSAVLTGDQSLRARPMERIAGPLRRMGAEVVTERGRPPVRIGGAVLRGIVHVQDPPSAQVKGALLFAGLGATGETTVREAVPTRDHTERALEHLGAPVQRLQDGVRIAAYRHGGFRATVPGDVSSAAFLVGAAALTRSSLVVRHVGLNPTRTSFLRVLDRMGVPTRARILGEELGEPVGDLEVVEGSELRPVTVDAGELALVIDEVPVLAALAASASGESRFLGASELRVKESDRLNGLASLVRALGGSASVEGDDLVVGGGRLRGGHADARGDHRMAMAGAVAALAATADSTIDGMESVAVSFPGFVTALRSLGARLEVADDDH